MLTANEIRKRFLDFFASHEHKIIPSDSLVPKEDPTVLFTTAGMQQFKRQFLGQLDGYTRAATSQKCLRTDDLDKVGKTAFHHTFFEMLGNFSFGDYFKKDAIEWAWEFLTKELKLPAEKLWVSVYHEDEEAYAIWRDKIKIPAERIVKLGDKSNFWPSDAKEKGPNGPCGPCSEIFYDYGVNPHCPKKDKCDPDCSCGRFSEVWNLVFTQFNRKDGGVLEPLPAKNIDTGMGLERLVAVVQGKKSNYETDLFVPILHAIDQELKKQNIKFSADDSSRIMADHIRAIVFAIHDGVIPSNKERGSVIKRLINDLTDMILRNQGKPFVHKLVPTVVTVMQDQYPELKKKENDIALYIEKTADDYQKVFQTKIPEFQAQMKTTTSLAEPERTKKRGELMFIYRDTFGLTLSTILLTIDKLQLSDHEKEAARKEFDSLMKIQQDKSRAGSKMTGDVFADAELNLNVSKTQFTGYKESNGSGKILKLFFNSHEVNEVKKGDAVKVVLDATPFYAESGGQIGDTGFIVKTGASIRIEDTQKTADVFVHSGTVEEGSFKLNDQIETRIDLERRLSIMRNHTATHLLQAALREVLGAHVQQQGSLVAEERLRFDFTHPQAITKEQLHRIESMINRHVLSCDPVQVEVMSREHAQKSGALAFFAEKYGESVRVVSIDGYSKEFCGGTHLNSTGQVGLFKIVGENAIAQGIRRIEAVTGTFALQLIAGLEKQVEEVAQILKSPVNEITVRAEKQIKTLKELEQKLEQLNFDKIKNSLDSILKNAQEAAGIKIVSAYFDDIEVSHLRKISDLIKQKEKFAIIILGSQYAGSVNLLLAITDEVIKNKIHANELIKDIAPLINGSGGGRPQLAQAGSKETDKIESAVKQAAAIVKEKLQK